MNAFLFNVGVSAHLGCAGASFAGPNSGRILEFSKNETMHGEVVVQDGKFVIALLDNDMKSVALADQTITASGGRAAKT